MTKTFHRTDHELQNSIQDELSWTPSVNADHIGVAVTDGAVTLSGQVKTYPQKDAAVSAALHVRGVKALVDNIVVAHSYGTQEDADVAREATGALDKSVILADSSVRATVRDHVITLTGELPWEYQRQAARQAVASLPGVAGVWNEITLTPHDVTTPARAKADIKAALVRNAAIEADDIDVAVSGSKVTLTGSVSSWDERYQAERSAWSSPGVMTVENNLTVTF